MKKLIIILLLMASCSSSKPLMSNVYINIFYDTGPLYCGNQVVKYSIGKKRILIISEKLQLDLEIVKRGVGEYNSWIGRTGTNRYYYISAVQIDGHPSMLLQPIEFDGKKATVVDYMPNIVISTKNICNK